MSLRNVIVHYHFFKNAGTSLDHSLKKAFPGGWLQLETDAEGPVTADRILSRFREQPELVVLSSHTARLALPRPDDMQIFPLVFIRHPLDRVLSVYQFERRQTEDTEGSLQARKLELPAFVEWRLDRPRDHSFRNFQVHRLAGLADDGGNPADPYRQGLEGLQKLPFVGLVEAFDQSIHCLQAWLRPWFADIELKTVKLNVTQAEQTTLVERLAHLKASLGPALYLRLLQENEADMQLYRQVAAMYDRHQIPA